MKSKIKDGMKIMFCFMLVILLGASSPIYAADVEVDKEEFDKVWKEAYEELPPEARQEFYKLTVEAFKEGEAGYAPKETSTDERAVPSTERRGQTRRDTAPAGERGRGPRGDRTSEVDRERRGGPGPIGRGAGPDYGPTPGAPPGLSAHRLDTAPGEVEDFLKSKGLSDADISKVRTAQDEIGAKADGIVWGDLSPDEARIMNETLRREFVEKTGYDPDMLLGDMEGPFPRGPEGQYYTPEAGEFYGPRIGGQTYGAGRTEGSYGPRMEDSTLQEQGYSDADIQKIRRAEDEIGIEASKIEWNRLTSEEALEKELELQRQFKEISGHEASDVFMMQGPQSPTVLEGNEQPIIFTDRPLAYEPEGYRPPIGQVWNGEGPMPPAFDPYAPRPIGADVELGPDGLPIDPYAPVGPRAFEPISPEGPHGPFEPIGPVGPEGPYAPISPEGPHGPFEPIGPVGPEGPYAPIGPEGPMYGPAPEGPHFESPMYGPAPEGPYMESPMYGPAPEGPHFEGPGPMYGPEAPGGFEGPYMEGPMYGPAPEGPMMEGPYMEGPYVEGPYMEGPIPEGPMSDMPDVGLMPEMPDIGPMPDMPDMPMPDMPDVPFEAPDVPFEAPDVPFEAPDVPMGDEHYDHEFEGPEVYYEPHEVEHDDDWVDPNNY